MMVRTSKFDFIDTLSLVKGAGYLRRRQRLYALLEGTADGLVIAGIELIRNILGRETMDERADAGMVLRSNVLK